MWNTNTHTREMRAQRDLLSPYLNADDILLVAEHDDDVLDGCQHMDLNDFYGESRNGVSVCVCNMVWFFFLRFFVWFCGCSLHRSNVLC